MRAFKPLRIAFALVLLSLFSFTVYAKADFAVVRAVVNPHALVWFFGSLVLLFLIVMLSTARDRVKCPHCGQNCSRGEDVCEACGYSFITKSAPKRQSADVLCPSCRHPNRFGQSDCEQCGHPL